MPLVEVVAWLLAMVGAVAIVFGLACCLVYLISHLVVHKPMEGCGVCNRQGRHHPQPCDCPCIDCPCFGSGTAKRLNGKVVDINRKKAG